MRRFFAILLLVGALPPAAFGQEYPAGARAGDTGLSRSGTRSNAMLIDQMRTRVEANNITIRYLRDRITVIINTPPGRPLPPAPPVPDMPSPVGYGESPRLAELFLQRAQIAALSSQLSEQKPVLKSLRKRPPTRFLAPRNGGPLRMP